MRHVQETPTTAGGRCHPSGPAPWDERVLEEVGAAIFTSLRRSDQRKRGADYLRGLLAVDGRRSIRNLASLLGGSATEQSLHHFVCDSTWDWSPVRRALACHLADRMTPSAWVVRPMVIPKAGENSVGVERLYVSEAGQLVNAQHACGVWAATEDMSAPVNWRLHLAASWLDDERRRQASIPGDVGESSLGESAVEAVLETARDWGVALRPVVLDARGMDVSTTVRRLRRACVPFLARVSGSEPLTSADPAFGARVPQTWEAARLTAAARDRMRPVPLRGPEASAEPRMGVAALVRVRPAGPVRRFPGAGGLGLLGVGETRRQGPDEWWLTDMTSTQPHVLVRLSRLTRRVELDFYGGADRLGIRDFTGRSYGGWHRHATLSSAAHAVSMLSVVGRGALAEAC
ncbi:transposase [Streptomyces sp. CS7]|uniref:IS701 family transposase n=1 Tax=Streptomyces sp. CS-7 TaxID=2906769 RepID=UPI0021B4D1C6|nr:transposase [Streptomyces sp. CS-7]MCT6776166.1 transposase [Streptomyces sp. CS-7]